MRMKLYYFVQLHRPDTNSVVHLVLDNHFYPTRQTVNWYCSKHYNGWAVNIRSAMITAYNKTEALEYGLSLPLGT